MNATILFSVITLVSIGILSAGILYVVAQKFYVAEDPRIEIISEVLPQANCGGCGYAGCKNFAESIVSSGTLEGFNCPVGGAEVMKKSERSWD